MIKLARQKPDGDTTGFVFTMNVLHVTSERKKTTQMKLIQGADIRLIPRPSSSVDISTVWMAIKLIVRDREHRQNGFRTHSPHLIARVPFGATAIKPFVGKERLLYPEKTNDAANSH